MARFLNLPVSAAARRVESVRSAAACWVSAALILDELLMVALVAALVNLLMVAAKTPWMAIAQALCTALWL
jgi:hypothetical protein